MSLNTDPDKKKKTCWTFFFCLTRVFVCFSRHTVTPWPRSETRHLLDLDMSLKAHANTHKVNTEACSCLDLTAGLSIDTDRAFVCLVSSPAAISHRTPLLTFYASAQQELGFVISYFCGWRSLLQCSAHVAAGLPCCVDNTARCWGGMRGATSERWEVMWKSVADEGRRG